AIEVPLAAYVDEGLALREFVAQVCTEEVLAPLDAVRERGAGPLDLADLEGGLPFLERPLELRGVGPNVGEDLQELPGLLADLRDLFEQDPQVRDGIGCVDRRVQRLDVVAVRVRLAAVGDEADDQLGSPAERAELAFHAVDGLLRDRLLEADPFRLCLALEGRRD